MFVATMHGSESGGKVDFDLTRELIKVMMVVFNDVMVRLG